MTQRTSVWIVELKGRHGWYPLILETYLRKSQAEWAAGKFDAARVRRYDRVAERTRKPK
jgi:hypothetical protein